MEVRTFTLTSPHMGSKFSSELKPHIIAFQNALKRQTPQRFHGKCDGEYGPETAQAVYDTKFYDFGYKEADRVAGDSFYAYLTGSKKPNALMRMRSKKRKAVHDTLSRMIFKMYISKLGETEHPANSNKSYASLWYGLIGAWCAMAYSWAANHAGSKIFKAGAYCAYVPTLVYDARNHRNGLKAVFKPFSGCGVCFKWPGESSAVADHIGCYAEEVDLQKLCPVEFGVAVQRFGHLGANEFWTIEGNTAIGNNSNGGEQIIRKRDHSTVAQFFCATT